MAANLKDKNLTLKSRYLAVNFIGLIMIASVFVYAGVVELIKWHRGKAGTIEQVNRILVDELAHSNSDLKAEIWTDISRTRARGRNT